MIDEKKLKAYSFKEDEIKTDRQVLEKKVKQVVELLKKSKRPVFLAGQGVRIAGACDPFISLIERLNIPTLTSFCGVDLIPSTHPLSMGRPGTLGSRYANFTLQNADLLISVGTRNNIRQISYTRGVFARSAKKVIVDVDAAELKKPTVVPDLAICADAKDFILELYRQSAKVKLPDNRQWLRWCSERKKRYPVVLNEYWKSSKLVNPYCFMQSLSKALSRDAVVVAGDGTACVGLFQAGVVTGKQRMIWNSGCAAMGYDIPASIGACFGLGKKSVVCLAGDGSSQMNIQELQTIVHHKLPIKIFILNNQGYLSIKQTQDSFFEGRRVACDVSSGVSFPDMIQVAKAYGLATERITKHSDMNKKIAHILKKKGPVVCEVMLTPDQKFAPRVSSAKLPDGRMVSKPLEDMYPFLDRKEFLENMLVTEYSGKN